MHTLFRPKMAHFITILAIICMTSRCLAQMGPMQPRNQQPNTNPNIQMPPNNQNFQPGVSNPNFQPGVANPNFQPGVSNPNFQPGVSNPNFQPGVSNPNMQPPRGNAIPVTSQNQPNSIPVGPGNQPGMVPGQQPPVMAGTQNGSPPNMPPPQLSPGQQSDFTCAQAGRNAVSQCFQQNGGFQMLTVIALLSNGTQGQLPQNPDQVKQTLCQSQKQIVSCVFTNIARFNNSQQCATPASFVRLEQETVGLLNGVQQMCGKGLMPKVTPCMQRLNYDMVQCYSQVGLNPELFSPRGSRMEGAIIGDNREVARMFCGKTGELNTCQNKILDNCEGGRKLQALSGNDQSSIHAGNEVLCNSIDVYVSGLVCFQSPSPAVQTCASRLITQMTEVTMMQIRDNLNADQFFVEYCKVRLNNLQCDSEAWGKRCAPVAVGLKREYQCNLLPSQCKNNPAVQDLYSRACAVETFARELRGSGSGGHGNGGHGNGHGHGGLDGDSGAMGVMAGISTLAMSLVTLVVLV